MTNSFNAENITFRTYGVHADLVKEAAERKGKTVSEYCRDIVIPWAASDLDVEVPRLPDMKRGRDADLIARAAKAAGLDPDDFERRAAVYAAAQALGYEVDESVPLHTPARAPAPRHATMMPAAPATVPPPSGQREKAAPKRSVSGTHRRAG